MLKKCAKYGLDPVPDLDFGFRTGKGIIGTETFPPGTAINRYDSTTTPQGKDPPTKGCGEGGPHDDLWGEEDGGGDGETAGNKKLIFF